jgi:hypothetical protein
MHVKDLDRYNKEEDLILVDLSQDVKAVKEHLGKRADKYDSFFVAQDNGDYTRVYGMHGIIPWLDKEVHRINLRR